MSDSPFVFLGFSALVTMALWTSLAVGSDLMSDPTKPPATLGISIRDTASVADEVLELRAILFAEGRRVAIINDHRVSEQDRIGSARVIEIRPDRVRLRRSGKNFDLELSYPDIKNASRPTSPKDWGAQTKSQPSLPADNRDLRPPSRTDILSDKGMEQ